MKEILKSGLALSLRIIAVSFMCFLIVISMSVLTNFAFTKEIGYTAFGVAKGEQTKVELYKHYFADGEDLQKAEFEKQGYTVTESIIRSDISKIGNLFFYIVTQIICLGMLISFIYPNLWKIGTTDSNLVKFNHKNDDKLKGFKIGMVPIIPFLLLWIVALIGKGTFAAKLTPVIFNFLNAPLYIFSILIVDKAPSCGELSLLNFIGLAVLQLIIPILASLFYLMGYKNFSISEKLIYKKN